MKKTRSKKTRDTIPLKLLKFSFRKFVEDAAEKSCQPDTDEEIQFCKINGYPLRSHTLNDDI